MKKTLAWILTMVFLFSALSVIAIAEKTALNELKIVATQTDGDATATDGKATDTDAATQTDVKFILTDNTVYAVPGTTVKDLTDEIEVDITDGEGQSLQESDTPLCTGFMVSYVGENEITVVLDVVVLGDVDADGKVLAADARLALRQAVELENLEGAFLKAADVEVGEGVVVDAADARCILRGAVELEKPVDWLVNFVKVKKALMEKSA